MNQAAKSLKFSRYAISAVFFVNGMILASWVATIPLAQQRLGLSEGVLGLTLLSLAVGSLIAMPLTGFLVGRFGSRRMISLLISAFVLSLFLPLNATNLPLLVLSLIIFGGLQGASDVAMNASAVALENVYPKPIMSSCHGFWSLGSLGGAAFSGLLIYLEVPSLGRAAIMATIGAALLFFALPRLIDARDGRGEGVEQTFALPRGPVLIFGLLTFFALVSEGAIADWAAVYLRDYLGSSTAFATLGFAAFSLTMALARFTGDALTSHFGPARVLRFSGVISALGLALALLVPQAYLAVLGFALMGLGVANFAPLLFGAAARVPGSEPGVSLAAVTTVGYFGFLVGPPLIGLSAEVVGLRASLYLVVGFLIIITLFARKVKAATPHTAVSSSD